MVDPAVPVDGPGRRGPLPKDRATSRRRPRWVLVAWVLMGVLIVGFLILHVATGGLGQH